MAKRVAACPVGLAVACGLAEDARAESFSSGNDLYSRCTGGADAGATGANYGFCIGYGLCHGNGRATKRGRKG
jgi:hypothetical protein